MLLKKTHGRGAQKVLEAIDEGLSNVIYDNTLLGRLDERTGKITGASFRSDEC